MKVLEFVWCKIGHIVATDALHLNCSLITLKIKHPSFGIEHAGAVAFAEIDKTLKEFTSNDLRSTTIFIVLSRLKRLPFLHFPLANIIH